jgi:hypothetical protein
MVTVKLSGIVPSRLATAGMTAVGGVSKTF